jgi:hypothetical protein
VKVVKALTILAGVALMLFAAAGAVGDGALANAPALARWVLGSALAHDVVLAPVVTAVAAVLRRWAPRWWGGPVTVALALSGIAVLVSWPLVRGYGLRPATPSALPRPYGTNLLVVLAAVWLGTAAVVTTRALRPTRRPT